VLFAVLLVCALLAQATVAQATSVLYLEELEGHEPPAIETIRPISEETNTPVAILYIPGLTWNSIAERNTEQTAQLLKGSAVGNLSAPKDGGVAALLENPQVGRYAIAEHTFFPATALTINTFLTEKMPADCLLIIVTAPLFNGGEPAREYTPAIIYGGGLFGYLTSDSTHRAGLITSADLTALYNHLNEAENSPLYSKATIKGISAHVSPDARAQHLQHDLVTSESVLTTKAAMNFAFLALVFFTFALSILLSFLGKREKPGSRGVLIPAVRILWLIVLAFPPATFLMFSLLPAQPSGTDLTIAVLSWVGVISFAALLVGWHTKWVNSLIALYGLTIGVIIIGQVFGGPLNTAGYLTYDITEGARYYGMGNEQGAMLFGAWITLSGLLINRYPNALGIPAFKRWGYPLGSAILLFIATSPWLGASFGPLVWGFLGCFFSWWLFNGRRLRWWLVVLTLVAAFGLALGVLYADITFNPSSHMYHVTPSMEQGFFTLITGIANDVWVYSLDLIRNYVPTVIIVFLILVFILLVVLRVLQPGTYREFWQRNTAFRATYSVCFVLAAITFILEDSGVFTPAVLLIYPISCFVWLICDLHSWHLRMLAEGPTERPITLRELQQSALGLLSRDNVETAEGGDVDEGAADGEAGVVDAGAADGEAGVVEAGAAGAGARASAEAGRRGRRPLRDAARGEAAGEADVGEAGATSTDGGTNEDAKPQPSVGRSTATMSAATLLSRFTGFARTWAMGAVLGVTGLTSAYTIANNLPNTLFELFAGGVFATAFLPVYLAQLEKRGKDGASAYASNLLSIGAIALGLISLLATIFAPQVVFTQSFLKSDGFDVQNAVFFFRFFAIQMVFYGVGSIISGLLNAHRSFLWPALGPVFNNIVVIITFFGYPFIARFSPGGAMVWLAIGTTLGVVAIFVVQIPALIKLKIPLRFRVDLKDPALKDTLKIALPAVLFIIMNVIAVAVMNACSLSVTAKGPATIQFAWLWYQLPYGVIAVALSTALLTEMSAASAAEDWKSFRNNVRLGLRSTIFLIIPLAAIIFTMSNQLAGLYHAGEFTYDDVVNVAQVVAAWCVALPFYASYMFIYRIFSSMRDLNRFIVIDAAGRILLITLYGFFTTGFGLFDGLGLIGIPLADACVYALLTAVMLFVLRKRIGTFGLTGIVFDGGKILLAALLANVIPFIFSFGSYDQSIPVSLATIAVCGIFALAVYYVVCRVFKVPETELIRSFIVRVKGLVQRGKGRRRR
jgi:putative peptidoglycan lipid II flippase